jgi:TolA-binding protein
MWDAVQTRLADPGAAAVSTAAGAAPSASVAGVIIKLSLVAAVVGGAIAIVASSAGEHETAAVDATPPPAPAALPLAVEPEPAQAREVAAAPAPEQEPPPEEAAKIAKKPPAAPAAATGSSLEREKTLLRAAQRALKDGDPKGAFRRLREHERRFPAGDLAELRMALRVTVLCDLGRTDEARAEAERFLRTRPGSPLAARVRTMCSKG